MFSLTLWMSANQLSQHIKFQTECDLKKPVILWEILYKEYKKLQILAEMINNVIGAHITCYLLSTIVYYAIKFDQMISGAPLSGLDWSRVPVLIFYIGCACTVLIVSADVCRQV